MSALAGYLAGIFTAPKSGKETRADVKRGVENGYVAAERELKKLHTELADLINEVGDRLAGLKDRGNKGMDEALARGREAKQKAREVLSTLHDGDTDDRDLKKAINDATKAIEHLRDFLHK